MEKTRNLSTQGVFISQDELEVDLGSKVGEGCNCYVFKADLHGRAVAVKIPNRRVPKQQKQEERKRVNKELQLLANLHHDNICEFVGFTESNGNVNIVMELMKGDIRRLMKNDFIPLKTRISWLRDIASAMKYVHQKGVMHRDIKPANMLYNESGTVKICDWGLSDFYNAPFKDATPKGSPIYMAPEAHLNKMLTLKLDVYAFAISAWEIITGKPAYSQFKTCRDLQKGILRGVRPTITASIPPIIANLLKDCWAYAADKRPTFEEIETILNSALHLHLDLHQTPEQVAA